MDTGNMSHPSEKPSGDMVLLPSEGKSEKCDDPHDKGNMVYVIFIWLGVGTLLPWNFFISVNAYWEYKFRTVHVVDDLDMDPADDESLLHGNGTDSATAKNPMQIAWPSQMAVASMLPNVTFLILNAVFGHRFRTQPRLLISLILVILLFGLTAGMTLAETDSWQQGFLVLTLVSVVLINVFASIFQGGLIGVSGKFPPRYIGGVFSGQAVGGIFASVTNVMMMLLGADPVYAAFSCFVIAVVFLAGSMFFYFVVSRSEFFHHYLDEKPKKRNKLNNVADGDEGYDVKSKILMPTDGPHPPPAHVYIPDRINPLHILGKIFPYALTVFLVFVVTLACFPAITVQVASVNPQYETWSRFYFIPVCCFVLFNVGDYLGRLLAEWLQFPRPGKFGMICCLIVAFTRLAFIPLFLFCNANPEGRVNTPVLFPSDIVYIALMSLFSLSNGYIANVVMISAPQVCLKKERQTASSLMVAILGLGLCSGAMLSGAVIMAL